MRNRSLSAALLLAASSSLLTTPAQGGTFKQITIDGAFDDWIGVPLAYEDPADSETSADYRRIWIANDEDFLYLRFTLERPVNPFTATSNLFIDSDDDPGTGFGIFIGSEMLVQSGVGYQERDGGFNEGAINGLEWQAAPAGEAVEFEARLSRHATFASDGTPVFVVDYLSLLLEAEDSNFTRRETAPDAEGIPYEFAPPPPPFSGRAGLVSLTGPWRYSAASAALGADWRGPEFDDTQAGWASGSALFGYSDNAAVYPAPLVTPLVNGSVAHYLRTRFSWNSDPAGVVFVATNYLSDGAVVYLNGAEVRRVRMPAGAVGVSTPATGGPATPGQAELFAMPTGPLVQGDNVLAVEVHQATGTPADLVFGLSLLAASEFPVVLPEASEPADRGVLGGESTTWRVEVIGSAPLSYQWLKDGQPIDGATGPSLVLDPVLPADAGAYSVRVSNPLTPEGVESRAGVLTVISTPVGIVAQPRSLTVAEGRSATFSVAAEGTAPIAYQWYKGDVALEGANSETLLIPSVTLADAGDYSVEVSNPAPSSVRSAVARLVVSVDRTPPSWLSVSGAPNRIVLTFSEPLDGQASRQGGEFQVSGGVQVNQVDWEAASPEVLTLLTSPQALGTRYEVAVSGVVDLFGNPMAGPVRRAFVSTILIDGQFDDWAGLTEAVEDPADAENATDYARAWVFNDAEFLYLRVQLHTASDFGIFYNNLFFDTDNDVATGFSFRGLGSEMLIQGGGGYQEKNGGFNEGPIEGLDWRMQPEGVATDFEVRISRQARYANDGLPVFASPTMAFYLESENTSFVTIDVAPDFEPIVYTFLDVPPAELSPLVLGREGAGLRLEWTGPGRLQSATSIVAGPWQDVGGASSPYVVNPTGEARFYRLILNP